MIPDHDRPSRGIEPKIQEGFEMLKLRFKNIGKFAIGFVAVATMSLIFAAESAAQLQPPLSPWLNMFNNNRGSALSNYHTFVRPEQQIIQGFQTQERQLRQQASQQSAMQGEVDKILNMPKQRPSAGGMRGCGFGQHMHYYQNIPAQRVPQFHTPGRAR